jgi:hypothetical protein
MYKKSGANRSGLPPDILPHLAIMTNSPHAHKIEQSLSRRACVGQYFEPNIIFKPVHAQYKASQNVNVDEAILAKNSFLLAIASGALFFFLLLPTLRSRMPALGCGRCLFFYSISLLKLHLIVRRRRHGRIIGLRRTCVRRNILEVQWNAGNLS